MEFRHLRYFEAVATELNFRRAAERLRVAQPALSRQIKDLEDDVGARLLDRDTTHVRLTDAGRVLLAEARQIIGSVTRAAELAREAAAGSRGQLAVGNIGPITASFMPRALAEFRVRLPGVTTRLVEIEPSEQIAAVHAGVIEVGFTVDKHPVLPAALCTKVVCRSPIRVVTSQGHRLARRRRLRLSDLTEERMLCFAGQRLQTHADLVREIFAGARLSCPPLAIVAGFESLLAMIGAGEGMSLMPRHVIVPAANRLRIIELNEADENLTFCISAVWRDGVATSLARQFVEQLGQIDA